MRKQLFIHKKRENQFSGVQTWEMSKAAADVVTKYLRSQGKAPENVIRSYKINKDGFVTFQTGIGYAIVDADVLGGSGDGSAESEFQNATDSALAFISGRRTKEQLAQWA